MENEHIDCGVLRKLRADDAITIKNLRQEISGMDYQFRVASDRIAELEQELVDAREATVIVRMQDNFELSTVQAVQKLWQLKEEGWQKWGAAEATIREQSATIERLKVALEWLANEASGFKGMADPFVHGPTNMAILGLRIDEARDAVTDAILNPQPAQGKAKA